MSLGLPRTPLRPEAQTLRLAASVLAIGLGLWLVLAAQSAGAAL